MARIELREDRCKGCFLCIVACRRDVLKRGERLNALGHYPSVVDKPQKCIGCALCAEVCPETIISVYKDE